MSTSAAAVAESGHPGVAEQSAMPARAVNLRRAQKAMGSGGCPMLVRQCDGCRLPGAGRYFAVMIPRRVLPVGFVEPCIPGLAAKPPSGPDWVHEIKHDGYWLMVRRDGDTVRLFTRRGHDWTDRYSAIARAAANLRAKSFTTDGEAVVSGRAASVTT
jgi:hypothetical protein